ncbi:MAG TPA: hypothetical protein VHX59_05155 [Mycobacteriales bacterium]|jgi:hypothetical protein|nr:hypothetical protein [Mycobacteriales bacterium]
MTSWPSGIFTAEQALQLYGRPRVRRWLDTGVWTRPFRGVYVSADTQCDDQTSIQLALMSAGADLVVVRESAAVLHGFGVLEDGAIHLAGDQRKTARTPPGIHIHGYKLPPKDITHVAGVATTTAARTVVDLARSANRLDALAVVDLALRVNACSPEGLAEQALSQRSSRGIVQARRIVDWGDPAAESPMESRARLHLLDSDLPAPAPQWWVRDHHGKPIYRLDLAWPEYRVGLEYDGVDHLDRARQRSDIERRAWLTQNGWRILWVTDVDVYRAHVRMVARVRRLIQATPDLGDHAEMVRDTPYGRTISA